ncbi:helix-turn-helix domain-containing protein [Salinigranum sp.]|uniref:helix-turn-helix domain-containing protein n=1 Tax=Salinigranum sp. TaxID=1966351 RepID=UPI0035637335
MSVPDDSERTSPPSDEEQRDPHDSMVVLECAIPASDVALETLLGTFPDVVVETERLVPTNHSPLPYLWTDDRCGQEFYEALVAEPSVDRAWRVATFSEGALYRLEWREDRVRLLEWLADSHESLALLEASATDGEWTMKFRFPDRSALGDFRSFYRSNDIDVRIHRLYDLTQPKLGQYNVTEKQREALIRALEMGHFDIPREATQADVGEALGITAKSVSERLRRGQTNLINNSLTVGQPTGIGLDEKVDRKHM